MATCHRHCRDHLCAVEPKTATTRHPSLALRGRAQTTTHLPDRSRHLCAAEPKTASVNDNHPPRTTMPNKLTLFTNLEQLTLNNIRMQCHALLLECRSHSHIIRGFGPSPSWRVFELGVPSAACEYENRSAPAIYTSDAAGGKTAIFRTGIIKIGGTPMQYVASDPAQDLDVFEIEDHDGTQLQTIWQELTTRVERYWTAPFIQVLSNRQTRQEQDRIDRQYARGVAASNPPRR